MQFLDYISSLTRTMYPSWCVYADVQTESKWLPLIIMYYQTASGNARPRRSCTSSWKNTSCATCCESKLNHTGLCVCVCACVCVCMRRCGDRARFRHALAAPCCVCVAWAHIPPRPRTHPLVLELSVHAKKRNETRSAAAGETKPGVRLAYPQRSVLHPPLVLPYAPLCGGLG